MKSIIQKILTFLNMIIPKKRDYILFMSHPDLTDNSYALYDYLTKNHLNNWTFIWLVESNFSNSTVEDKNTKLILKKSFLGFYYFCRSKYIFFTHNNYASLDTVSSQMTVNLWHGMPLKNIGHLDNRSYYPRANYTIATSFVFQEIMAKSFNQTIDEVLISGQPRNQYLLEENKNILNKLNIDYKKYKKIIAWLPTYRKSSTGELRNDGMQYELLPLMNLNNLKELDFTLKKYNIFLIVKLHPVDSMSVDDFETYTNIVILDNEFFQQHSIQLYSLLANTDALITDYSSVYIDYMLTKKPIAFVIPDLESYNNSRGFTIDNVVEHLPGTIIQKKTELENFIHDLAEDKISASYIDDGLFEFYHSVDNHFSENIYNVVFNQAGKL